MDGSQSGSTCDFSNFSLSQGQDLPLFLGGDESFLGPKGMGLLLKDLVAMIYECQVLLVSFGWI